MFNLNFTIGFLIYLYLILRLTVSAKSDEEAWRSFRVSFAFVSAFLMILMPNFVQFNKMTYRKKYKSLSEKLYRKKIFIQNLHAIDRLNYKYEEESLKFTCAVNSYADLTTQEFVDKHAGLRVSLQLNEEPIKSFDLSKASNSTPVANAKSRANKNSSLPSQVDWRPTAVTPVKRQVACRLYFKNKSLTNFSAGNVWKLLGVCSCCST